MNPLNWRLMSKARAFNANHNKYIGILQKLARSSTSENISPHEMQEQEGCHGLLPAIIDNLKNSSKISKLPEVGNWVKKVLEHNLTGGKHSIGLWAVFAYEMLEKPENITEEYLKLCRVLQWCVEMTRAHFCVNDDIMDGSTTRAFSPCWHRMPNVGLSAVNDGILMLCSVTETIETYFMKTPHYVDLLRLLHEAILYSSMGQHLDFTTGSGRKPDYRLFTIERYDTIVKYKTSLFIRLPVLLGLTLVKDVDKRMYADVDEIVFELGKLYQMQDDYIDCYGDEELTGKAGNDIQEGKCTWLAATALQICNPEQKDIFTKYYGSEEPEDEAIIKRLYHDLQIPELFKQKEMKIHDDIVSRARVLPSENAPKLFIKLLDQLYKMKN